MESLGHLASARTVARAARGTDPADLKCPGGRLERVPRRPEYAFTAWCLGPGDVRSKGGTLVAMVPPIWLDAAGRSHPPLAC